MSRVRLAIPILMLSGVALFAADDVKPEAILDKYVEVTGGRAAYEKIKTELATGTVEVMGMNGTLTSYRAAPDQAYSVVDLSGLGKFEEGSNGQIAWAMDPMQGARIKEGNEKAAALRSAALYMETHWRDFYKDEKLAGSEDVGGKACYKLILTPNQGGPETRYYDKTSNLLVKVILPVTTPQGEMTAEMDFSDYRAEDGINTPHTIEQKLPTADIVVKIQHVKHNVDIPAGRFDLPAEVKALADNPAEKK